MRLRVPGAGPERGSCAPRAGPLPPLPQESEIVTPRGEGDPSAFPSPAELWPHVLGDEWSPR